MLNLNAYLTNLIHKVPRLQRISPRFKPCLSRRRKEWLYIESVISDFSESCQYNVQHRNDDVSLAVVFSYTIKNRAKLTKSA